MTLWSRPRVWAPIRGKAAGGCVWMLIQGNRAHETIPLSNCLTCCWYVTNKHFT